MFSKAHPNECSECSLSCHSNRNDYATVQEIHFCVKHGRAYLRWRQKLLHDREEDVEKQGHLKLDYNSEEYYLKHGILGLDIKGFDKFFSNVIMKI